MLVWTLVVGFAVGGEARSIAGYRRAYEAATDQSIFPSSFYDRFTEELARLLRDLLDGVVDRAETAKSWGDADVQSARDVLVRTLDECIDAAVRKRLTPVGPAHADEDDIHEMWLAALTRQDTGQSTPIRANSRT